MWETLLELVTAGQAMVLLGLVEVPEGQRISALERLRREPTGDTALALVKALGRAAEVTGIGLGGLDLSVVPHRRVVDLARSGMTANATSLRKRTPYAKRVATLLATVVYLEAKATDDALELFDVVMTSQLLARAERQSAKDQAKRYPRVSREAGRLAAAVGVLLEATELDQQMPVERIWDLIENVVPRAELRAAVALIHEVARRALIRAGVAGGAVRPAAGGPQVRAGPGRDGRVRGDRGRRPGPDRAARTAGAAGRQGEQAGTDRVLRRPARRRRGGADGVAAARVHRRSAAGDGGPGRVHVLRAVAVPCPAQTPRRVRRGVVAVADRAPSSSQARWLAKRDVLLESLDLPEDPDELLAECASELDGRWRHMAERAAAGEVNVGADGRLHAAALRRSPRRTR
ncbi:hypothetical protein NKG94_08850 [Micromonospora sp. M12]